MDELLETVEIMQDNKLVEDLRIALQEVEEGKTTTLVSSETKDLHVCVNLITLNGIDVMYLA